VLAPSGPAVASARPLSHLPPFSPSAGLLCCLCCLCSAVLQLLLVLFLLPCLLVPPALRSRGFVPSARAGGGGVLQGASRKLSSGASGVARALLSCWVVAVYAAYATGWPNLTPNPNPSDAPLRSQVRLCLHPQDIHIPTHTHTPHPTTSTPRHTPTVYFYHTVQIVVRNGV
jgi:hypothetical protein